MNNENNSFSYSYSGSLNEELEHIKAKYTKKETTEKIKEIRKLDKLTDFISAMTSIFIGLSGTSLIYTGTVKMIIHSLDLRLCTFLIIIGIIIITSAPFIHTKIDSIIKSFYAPEILNLIEQVEQNKL